MRNKRIRSWVVAVTAMGAFATRAPAAPVAASQPDTQADAQAASQPATSSGQLPPPSLFRDPEDGAFDVSNFLSSRTGFLPIVMPITEPAVGYGAAGGLVFFHEKPRVVPGNESRGPRVIPPIATAVFGAATENGTWFTGGGHLHLWNDGRVRYAAGGGYGSVHLDWYGQSDALEGRAVAYENELLFVGQKLTFQLGDTPFFLGPTQRLLASNVDFDNGGNGAGIGVSPDDLESVTSGLGVFLGYDTRNSLFSPTRGTKAGTYYTYQSESFGGDFDYWRAGAEVCQYIPLSPIYTLGLRGDFRAADGEVPFYELASVALRGIPALRFVDNYALTLEAELRWDVSRRWTLLGFGGAGWVGDTPDQFGETQSAGGAGFRYLVARQYDLRMGVDVAHGPDDWALYIKVGTGWLRD